MWLGEVQTLTLNQTTAIYNSCHHGGKEVGIPKKITGRKSEGLKENPLLRNTHVIHERSLINMR